MSRRFVVTGLPRCRTAWLSVLLDHGDSACRHDALRLLQPDEWGKAFPDSPVGGISDVAVACMAERAHHAGLLGGSVVLVVRDRGDASASLARHLGISMAAAGAVTEAAMRGMEYCAKHAGSALLVEFEDLASLHTAERIWEFCTGLPFDAGRAKELQRLNIQAKKDAMLDGLHEHWRVG